LNLIDLLDENGLQQNEWSLTAPAFGKDNQLTVVGWSGRTKANARLYILSCNKCSQDSELFTEGYFKSAKSNLKAGQLPCGCATVVPWSREQYFIRCARVAKEAGYTFLGFVGEWDYKKTKIKMLCEKHGEWSTGSIDTLLNGGRLCPGCGADATVMASTKPDDVMIDSFFASGAFHPDTKFWRSERLNSQGCKVYWFMSCPECGEDAESFSGSLQDGKIPCGCSKHHQRECYINLVSDGTVPVAIKFGVANNSKRRLKQQNSKSVYTILQYSVYVFPDIDSCKKAERECKKELECGVVLKRDMKDGYTETTYVHNLDKIIQIYKKHGGVEV
jgi:hypothetical protein